MTEHLGILMIIAGAALLLTGLWLLRKSKAAGVAQQGGTAAGEHAVGLGTMALDLPGASIEASLVDGVLTPKEEALIRQRAVDAGEDPETLLAALRQQLHHTGEPAEVELVDANLKAGFDFEKFVVTLLL